VNEDDRWWVVVIVDTNDNEAVWRGPYEDQRAAEKGGLALAAEIDDLESEGVRHFIADTREAYHQLGTDTRNRSLI
jgi:hypothetical protein